MMVHCTVVQPFIGIVGSIEMQSSERTEPQGDCSWVELWAAGRGGCCCCLRDLAELPGAAGPWMLELRCSRSEHTTDRADPCSLVSRSRIYSPHMHIWLVSWGLVAGEPGTWQGRLIVVSGPAMASACPFVVVWRRF